MYKGKGKTLKVKETLQSRAAEMNHLLARDRQQLGNQGPYTKTTSPGSKTPTTASKDKIAPRWT